MDGNPRKAGAGTAPLDEAGAERDRLTLEILAHFFAGLRAVPPGEPARRRDYCREFLAGPRLATSTGGACPPAADAARARIASELGSALDDLGDYGGALRALEHAVNDARRSGAHDAAYDALRSL